MLSAQKMPENIPENIPGNMPDSGRTRFDHPQPESEK